MTNITNWNIGTSDIKRFALGFYVVVNYLGVIINGILIWSILRARDKSSRDIFIVGLASGCLIMSMPCATQCLFNYISSDHSYQYGDLACYFEAYFHVTAIIVQFISIMLIAWNSYDNVINNKTIPVPTAAMILFIVWSVTAFGTILTSWYSNLILMPDGAYCFFDFKSVTIIYFFVPTMLITLILMIYFYLRIYLIANKSNTIIRINNIETNNANISRKVALRSLIFVVTYFIGWFPAIIACIYDILYGYLPESLDISLAIAGSLNSIWQPVAYGIFNRNLQKFIVYCCPKCGKYFNLESVKLRGKETVVTAETPMPRTPKHSRLNSTGATIQMNDDKKLHISSDQVVDLTYQQHSPDTLSPTDGVGFDVPRKLAHFVELTRPSGPHLVTPPKSPDIRSSPGVKRTGEQQSRSPSTDRKK